MATFITIGYGDNAGYERTDPAVRAKAHQSDAALVEAGATIGRAGDPVQVRNTDGERVELQPRAFLHAELPVAGFSVFEADDLDQAVAMASQAPCAVAHGVVEVWPLLP